MGAPPKESAAFAVKPHPTGRSEASLKELESESIEILRESVSEAQNPVMLYSGGKDSSVLLELAQRAFAPGSLPFPLLHVDTTWKFKEMISFRDQTAQRLGLKMLVHTNLKALEDGVNPFDHEQSYTDIMKTQALKEALDIYGFDVIIGGARRDEEPSRSKEKVFSLRGPNHVWNPREQRPEFWSNFNLKVPKGQTLRVFPISNWTELEVWQYIRWRLIPIVDLYLSRKRPVVVRDGRLIVVDDHRMRLRPGETPELRNVRFRTLGCYPLTAAFESEANTIEGIISEIALASNSERIGRLIDHEGLASMERKKLEGYF